MQRQENEEFEDLELEASLGHIEPCLKLRPAWAIMRPCFRRKKKSMSSISSLPKAVFGSLVFLHCPARTQGPGG